MSTTFESRALVVIALSSVILLLAAGGLLNAIGGALSVPDWPFSYGRLMLFDWPGNLLYEQAHRLLAALTLLLLPGSLAALVRINRALPLKAPATLATVLYLVQILMGGAVVLLLNPPLLGAAHVVVVRVPVILA